jgi:recombination protein U
MQYPNHIKKTIKNEINYANRGMSLEYDLNITNKYYLDEDIAIINKKPTPIKVVKVSFDNKKNATIKEAYYQTPSTTDYNGIYKNKYIDFEAKEVKNKRIFPLSNINAHQIKHIESIIKHGGIAFLIVRFASLNKTFLLRGETLIKILEEKESSIPLSVFIEEGFEIKEALRPRLNYLKIVNKVYLGGEK